MEIKIEFKAINQKVFDDLEETMTKAVGLLNVEQKTVLKHAIMEMKIVNDNLEKRIKNLDLELQELLNPKQEETTETKVVEKKPVEPETSDVVELDL